MDQFFNEILVILSSLDLSTGSNLIFVASSLIFCQIIFACFFLPCSQFSIISGVLFGPILGALINIISTTLSFIITYFIGRKFGKRIKSNRFKKFKNLISEERTINLSSSWQSLVFFYANPILPGSSMGYFFGIVQSDLRFLIPRSIVLITLPCLAYASMGSELLNLLVRGNYIFGFLILSFFFVLLKFIYPSTLRKINDKYDK
jgi:uncharacterized membrane protein YdjX (TVP38/TMEM64 family)